MTGCDRKKGSNNILGFLDELKQEWWISYGDREWWVDYLFHFSDINNVATILESGHLLSRNELIRQDRGFSDSADREVLEWTEDHRHGLFDYVRFYFRPFTATTYIMEGFKPGQKTAHCPVPIYLLFDMREIITCTKTRFSDGNLASQDSAIFSNQKDFRKLDFKVIYNDQDKWQSRKYKRGRQAEVIYPVKVTLGHLKYLCCRSPAEYETLRNLLPSAVWAKWKDRVKYSRPHRLFKKFWLHIEEVKLSQERIDILFNRPRETKDFGPFKVRVDIDDQDSEESFYFEREYENIVSELDNQTLMINLRKALLSFYVIKISINDALAYYGEYNSINE